MRFGRGGKATMEQAVHTPYFTGEIPEPNATSTPETAPSPKGGAGAAGVIGAVLSISLVLGLGVWGYKLAVRDVSGVPVVRALAGPMRIQPEDPGGESAPYQGYSVNTVQARGGVADPADSLALAPRNTRLVPGDSPVVPNTEASALHVPAPARPEIFGAAGAGEMQALADQLAADATPFEGTLTEITPTSSDGARATQIAVNIAVAAALSGFDIISASVPGVVRSPRPVFRPADLAQTIRASISSTDQPPASVGALTQVTVDPTIGEVAVADIAAGTRLVQLGAFDSPEVARAEWGRLMGQFSDYFDGKNRVIQEASSGGKTFFRLRALGFADLADTRRFCIVLLAGNAQCIPVMAR